MAIYFIRSGEDGPVKIGTARNVAKRLCMLQTGNPVELIVARVIQDGDRHLEQKFHSYFGHCHLRGEWFWWVDEMRSISVDALQKYYRVACSPKPAFRNPFHLSREPTVQVAIDKAGGVNALALAIGVKSSTVAQWDVIPARRLRKVSEVTGLEIGTLVPPDLAEQDAA